MNSSIWQPLRMALLAVTFTGAVGVLVRTVTAPKAESAAIAASSPLAQVPLEGWQLADTRSLAAGEDLPAGSQFQYRKGDTALDVQVRMMPGDGNISRFLFVHTPIRAANAGLQIRNDPRVGDYGVLQHDGKLYLSACVNPRGSSTVTEQQFMQNRYINDIQPGRVVGWVLGQEALLDQRCLWTLMSTPLPSGETSGADQVATLRMLESAWISWHQWWQANFPPS